MTRNISKWFMPEKSQFAIHQSGYSNCTELNTEHRYTINFLIGKLPSELRPYNTI